jgi:hypothetical protein
MVMKIRILWDIMRCNPLKVNPHFPGAFCLFNFGFLLDLLFNYEDGGVMFLRNVGCFQRTAQYYIPEDETLQYM